MEHKLKQNDDQVERLLHSIRDMINKDIGEKQQQENQSNVFSFSDLLNVESQDTRYQNTHYQDTPNQENPYTEEDVLELSDMLEDGNDQREPLFSLEHNQQGETMDQNQQDTSSTDDVLDLMNEEKSPEDRMTQELASQDKSSPEAEGIFPGDSSNGIENHEDTPRGPVEEPLLSHDALEQSLKAFQGLSQIGVPKSRNPNAVDFGKQTIEDAVHSALRPLLKEWLDANLPALVKWLVTEEISKVIKNAQNKVN